MKQMFLFFAFCSPILHISTTFKIYKNSEYLLHIIILSSYALIWSDFPRYTWANSREKLYPSKSWKEIEKLPSDILWRTSFTVGKIFSYVELILLFSIPSKHFNCWLVFAPLRVAKLSQANDLTHNWDKELIKSAWLRVWWYQCRLN